VIYANSTSHFPKGITSGLKSIRKRVIGQGEFSLIQILASEYDLQAAVDKFRFVLLSQVPPLILLLPSFRDADGDGDVALCLPVGVI
jgi:hypothetical protein